MFVVEVEPAFTNANALVADRERREHFPLRAQLRRLVGMQSHCRVHVVERARELDGLSRRLEIGTDAHHPLDTRGARPRHVRFAAGQLQMAVRVDPHGGHASSLARMVPARMMEAWPMCATSFAKRMGLVKGS